MMAFLSDQLDGLDNFKFLFNNKIARVNLFFSLFLNIFIWFVMLWYIRDFPEIIPLHYNIYFGIDLLGPWYQIFFIPVSGLITILANYFLAIIYWQKNILLSYFLIGVTTLIQILLLASALAIIYLSL